MKFRGVNGVFFCYKCSLLDHLSIKELRLYLPMLPIKNYYTIIRSTLLQYVPRGHLTAAVALSVGLVAVLSSNSPDSSAVASIPSKNIPGLEILGTETQ